MCFLQQFSIGNLEELQILEKENILCSAFQRQTRKYFPTLRMTSLDFNGSHDEPPGGDPGGVPAFDRDSL